MEVPEDKVEISLCTTLSSYLPLRVTIDVFLAQ
jgi:hypothetical protein